MVTEVPEKSIQYVYYVCILRHLRNQGIITDREFFRAKDYYERLTGTDICLGC